MVVVESVRLRRTLYMEPWRERRLLDSSEIRLLSLHDPSDYAKVHVCSGKAGCRSYKAAVVRGRKLSQSNIVTIFLTAQPELR